MGTHLSWMTLLVWKLPPGGIFTCLNSGEEVSEYFIDSDTQGILESHSPSPSTLSSQICPNTHHTLESDSITTHWRES